MSAFASLVASHGYHVELNSQPLAVRLAASQKGDVLFLGVAMFRQYSRTDAQAIRDFWRRGGNIISVVEHDNLMENASFQQPLLDYIRVVAHPSGITTSSGETAVLSWVRAESPVLGIGDLLLPYPAPITSRGAADTLLVVKNPANPRLSVAGIVKKHRSGGRWAVIGDAEVFWNGTEDIGLFAANNQAFLQALLNYLMPVRGVDGQHFTGIEHFLQLLEERGLSCGDKDTDRLLCHIVPLEAARLTRGRKTLVIADGGSDNIGALPEARDLLAAITGVSYEQPVSPVNRILRGSGLQVEPATLVSGGNGNHLEVNGRWFDGRPFQLVRSGYIRVSRADADILGVATNTWPLLTLTPTQVFGGRPTNPFTVPAEGTRTLPVVAKTPDFFVIANLALVIMMSNREIQSELADAVASWVLEEGDRGASDTEQD